MRVAAEIIVGLEERHFAGSREEPRGGESADAMARTPQISASDYRTMRVREMGYDLRNLR